MMFSPKTLAIALTIGFLTTICLGTIVSVMPIAMLEMLFYITSVATSFITVYSMYTTGILRYSPLRRVILLLFSAGILAALFKLQHWAGGNTMLPIVIGAVAVVYTIHFIRKQSKNLSDILKFGWISTAAIVAIGKLHHLLQADWTWVPQIFALAWCLLFITRQFRKKPMAWPDNNLPQPSV
jgi:asparagine N-glycosylation enzyme membrane subunit Stt3